MVGLFSLIGNGLKFLSLLFDGNNRAKLRKLSKDKYADEALEVANDFILYFNKYKQLDLEERKEERKTYKKRIQRRKRKIIRTFNHLIERYMVYLVKE